MKKQKFRKYVRKPKKFKPKKKQSKEAKETKEGEKLKKLGVKLPEESKKLRQSDELQENFSFKSGWDKFKLILYIVLIVLGLWIVYSILFRVWRLYKNVT